MQIKRIARLSWPWASQQQAGKKTDTSSDITQYLQFVARDNFFAFALRWIEDGESSDEVEAGYLRAALAASGGNHANGIAEFPAHLRRPGAATERNLELEARRHSLLLDLIEDRSRPYAVQRAVFRAHIDAACENASSNPNSRLSSHSHGAFDCIFMDLADSTGILLADYEQDRGPLRMSTGSFVRQLVRHSEWVRKQQLLLPNHSPALDEIFSELRLAAHRIRKSCRAIPESDQRGLCEGHPRLGHILRNLLQTLRLESLKQCLR